MKKWLIRGAIVVAIVAAWWILKATAFAPKPVVVEVAKAELGRVEQTITNSRAGSVKAERRADLSPEIGGRVVAIPHKEGESVAAGSLLLQMDDRQQAAQLNLAERGRDQAAADAEASCLNAQRAAREHQRIAALAQTGLVSSDELDQVASNDAASAAACKAAQAAVKRAGASVVVSERELAKTRIMAPFAGTIAKISTQVGEWITPSPPGIPIPPVIDLYDPDSIDIEAPMDEVDAAELKVGQRVKVTIDAYRGKTFMGHIWRVAPYVLDVESQNRTIAIDVRLDDTDFAHHLLPGTSADVEVILAVHPQVLRIPTSALLEGDRVLVFDQGQLKSVKVAVKLRNWDYTELSSGIAPGTEVVTSLDRPGTVAGATAKLAGSSNGQ